MRATSIPQVNTRPSTIFLVSRGILKLRENECISVCISILSYGYWDYCDKSDILLATQKTEGHLAINLFSDATLGVLVSPSAEASVYVGK